MARDKNKDELQNNQREQEFREQTQEYKAEINLPEEEFPTKDKDNNDSNNSKEK